MKRFLVISLLLFRDISFGKSEQDNQMSKILNELSRSKQNARCRIIVLGRTRQGRVQVELDTIPT